MRDDKARLYSFSFTFSSLPTDVQAEAVPLILGGGDVLMAAETGSGKTGVISGRGLNTLSVVF